MCLSVCLLLAVSLSRCLSICLACAAGWYLVCSHHAKLCALSFMLLLDGLFVRSEHRGRSGVLRTRLRQKYRRPVRWCTLFYMAWPARAVVVVTSRSFIRSFDVCRQNVVCLCLFGQQHMRGWSVGRVSLLIPWSLGVSHASVPLGCLFDRYHELAGTPTPGRPTSVRSRCTHFHVRHCCTLSLIHI